MNRPYLSAYIRFMKHGMPDYGLCHCFKSTNQRKVLLLITPSYTECVEHFKDGYSTIYWGRKRGDKIGEFNAFRQTIVLLCAALNGEFDKPKRKKK